MSPNSTGAFLPMSICANSGSRALAPRPSVSAKLSSPIFISVISAASLNVTSTATGPAKPCALATALPPAKEGPESCLCASFIASTTAWLVIVAPEIASMSPNSTGAFLPMSICANSGSRALAPRPSVSAKLSSPIFISVIPAASLNVTSTATGPAKPFTLALAVPAVNPEAAALSFSNASFALSIIGLSASSVSPSASTGACMPTNCSAFFKAALLSSSIISIASMVPSALNSIETAGFSSLASTLTDSSENLFAYFAMSLTPLVTAFDVIVAAVMASIVLSPDCSPAFITFTGVFLPANWDMNASSLDLAPSPAVSEKLEPPTFMPCSVPSVSTPTISSIGPP